MRNRHPTDGPNTLLNRLGHQFDAARVELSKHPKLRSVPKAALAKGGRSRFIARACVGRPMSSRFLPLVPRISASVTARRTDHWRSVVVVVGAADPPHRAVISRFTGGQFLVPWPRAGAQGSQTLWLGSPGRWPGGVVGPPCILDDPQTGSAFGQDRVISEMKGPSSIRNGAVASAVPSALRVDRPTSTGDWRERPALALLAGKPASRSNISLDRIQPRCF